jgi:hypothetical protein
MIMSYLWVPTQTLSLFVTMKWMKVDPRMLNKSVALGAIRMNAIGDAEDTEKRCDDSRINPTCGCSHGIVSFSDCHYRKTNFCCCETTNLHDLSQICCPTGPTHNCPNGRILHETGVDKNGVFRMIDEAGSTGLSYEDIHVPEIELYFPFMLGHKTVFTFLFSKFQPLSSHFWCDHEQHERSSQKKRLSRLHLEVVE